MSFSINIIEEIKKLKNNNSEEYNRAIDDVLLIFKKLNEKCSIVHKKSGLYFNGYDNNFPKGKNTLSISNSKKFTPFGRKPIEIIENAFKGHTVIKEDGICYIYNKIVYENSDINKILSKYYADTSYIPISDFDVEYDKN